MALTALVIVLVVLLVLLVIFCTVAVAAAVTITVSVTVTVTVCFNVGGGGVVGRWPLAVGCGRWLLVVGWCLLFLCSFSFLLYFFRKLARSMSLDGSRGTGGTSRSVSPEEQACGVALRAGLGPFACGVVADVMWISFEDSAGSLQRAFYRRPPVLRAHGQRPTYQWTTQFQRCFSASSSILDYMACFKGI